ncbi:hypothetical protein, partial [Sporisorium scitamineum]
MVKAISLLTTAVLALSSVTLRVKADCECGYLDPSTNHLWTDVAFSYFNETGLKEIVMNPAKSPKINGAQIAGDTGDGQQTWSAVGDHINPYEESFGATHLSAVSYNNTYIDNRTEGLAMEVSIADQKKHHVNGSTIVTRRRDILYGSFRASVKPPFIHNTPGFNHGYGYGFKFAVSYSDSENMYLNILTNDFMPNSTLGWSHSAARWNDDPEKQVALLQYDDVDERTDSPRSNAAADFEKPYKQIWTVPELMDDWGSDDESDIDEDDERFWESVDVLRSKGYKEDREANQPGLPQFEDATAMKPTASVESLDSYKFPSAGNNASP